MLIIGAGPVGLGVASALKRANIPFEQVDADDSVGGNWYHGVYQTAHIISSRNTTEFPDYPMPEGYPDFPSRQNMLDYLRDYAEHFGLLPGIEFNTRVKAVRPVGENRWEVGLESGEKRLYKGVLVCNGHHWSKRWPEYPGEFTGEYIHSKDYRQPEQLRGKRVLVIGGGNSACDLVSEAARLAERADLSLRNGVWFLPKTLFGRPLVDLIHPLTPVWLQRLLIRAALRVVVGRFEDYGLPRPRHRIFDKHPTISSEVLFYIKHGRITPRPGIARYNGNRVEFTDGSQVEYDLVVAATGYHVAYPFLPAELAPVEGPVVKCYAGSMLADYRHLYLLGWGQPRYGFGPLLTASGELLANFIKLQDELEIPLGMVFKLLGQRPPDNHLADPHHILRQLRLAKRTFPFFAWRARRLARAHSHSNSPMDEGAPDALSSPMTLY